jgi:hypothetical protein
MEEGMEQSSLQALGVLAAILAGPTGVLPYAEELPPMTERFKMRILPPTNWCEAWHQAMTEAQAFKALDACWTAFQPHA